jgi:hypothetical protein
LAQLTFPPVLRSALEKLSSLSDEAAAALLSAITSSVPVSNPKTMAARIASTTSIPHDDLEPILSALFSLSAFRVLNSISVPSLIDDVCKSLQIKMSDSKVSAVKERLPQLLQAESLVLGSKASALQREHANVLINARIVTDLRPVFGEGVESPEGAVIVHNLKLTSIQLNVHHETFFALDDDDLVMLQKAIARAEGKSRSLRAFLEKCGLPNIATSED